MIDVGYLYDKVNDILVANQGGYFSNDEFNRDLQQAQYDLLLYLTPGTDRRVNEVLKWLITDVYYTTDIAALPSDYYMRLDSAIEVGIGKRIVQVPAYELNTDDAISSIFSPVREPSITTRTAYFYIHDNQVAWFPKVNGRYMLRYLKYPPVAQRAVTIDTVNDIEVYDPVNSIHLGWPAQALPYFIDLLSYYRGIENRDSEVLQWVAAKNIKHDQRTNNRVGVSPYQASADAGR